MVTRLLRFPWCCCCCCRCCPLSPFLSLSSCLSPRLPFGSLRPSFLRRPVRPLAWLLARSCADLWRCACVVRGQHGSTARFATMSCICSTCGSPRARNSHLLLAALGPSPRPRAPPGPSPRPRAPWASTSLSCFLRSSRFFASSSSCRAFCALLSSRASCALLCSSRASCALLSSSPLPSSSPLLSSSLLFSSSPLPFLLRLLLALLVRF